MEQILFFIMIILFFLSWGSFLNVVAFRLAFDKPFFTKRSYCPACKKTIAWYDNIPVLSWLLLRGRCRQCKKLISWIYPCIELCTALVMMALFFKFFIHKFLLSYFIFFTALIISTAMDMHALVVSQLFTLWLVPAGFFFAWTGMIQITLLDSIIGAVFGYGVLWLVGFVFKKITKKDGMGVGDMELLALIGSFLGPLGVWTSLMVGSILGAVSGGIYMAIAQKGRMTRIPFGPFLSFGAIIYFFFQDFIVRFFI